MEKPAAQEAEGNFKKNGRKSRKSLVEGQAHERT
jgi:hypothetical protein